MFSILRMTTHTNPPPTSNQENRDSESPSFNCEASMPHQSSHVPVQQSPWKSPEDLPVIKPPHPRFPKPLGLAYRNFHAYYSKYKYEDGEQMEVANCLVSAMLQCYFPRSKFRSYRLPYHDRSLIGTVAVPGTIYWIVTPRAEEVRTKVEYDDAHIETKDVDENEDSKLQLPRPSGVDDSEIFLLIAIVTEKGFRRQKAREHPSTLSFSQAVPTNPEHATVAGHRFKKGHVVILGSRSSPVRPVWEFYTYHASPECTRSLLPWSGQTKQIPEQGHGTNSFTFATEDIEKVHGMFETIVRCSERDDEAIPMKLESKREALADVTNNAQLASNRALRLTDLEGIGIRSDGRLFDVKNGWLLDSATEKIAKREAAMRGLTFTPPKSKKRGDRKSVSREATEGPQGAAL